MPRQARLDAPGVLHHVIARGIERRTIFAHDTDRDAFARGILCNALVCLAVWLAMGGRSVADKILAILFPIIAFVTIGLEHSIANWFFLPFGLVLDGQGAVSVVGVGRNILAVSAGNMVGGTLLVACVYWVAYLRGERTMSRH